MEKYHMTMLHVTRSYHKKIMSHDKYRKVVHRLYSSCISNMQNQIGTLSSLSQLYYGLVVIYYMVYHYTKRVTLARLLANKGPAIYVVLWIGILLYLHIII